MSDGEWIEIRRELTVGQLRELSASLRRPGDPVPDYAAYPTARVLAYLVRWSLRDFSGAAAPISAGAIDQLEPATFTEITAAIDAHEAQLLEEKKRMTTPVPDDTAILQSVG